MASASPMRTNRCCSVFSQSVVMDTGGSAFLRPARESHEWALRCERPATYDEYTKADCGARQAEGEIDETGSPTRREALQILQTSSVGGQRRENLHRCEALVEHDQEQCSCRIRENMFDMAAHISPNDVVGGQERKHPKHNHAEPGRGASKRSDGFQHCTSQNISSPGPVKRIDEDHAHVAGASANDCYAMGAASGAELKRDWDTEG